MAAQIDAPTIPDCRRRTRCREVPGQGITALVDGVRVAIGSAAFVAASPAQPPERAGDRTYVAAGAETRLGALSAAAAACRHCGGGWTAGARARHPPALGRSRRSSRRAGGRLFGRRMRFRQSPEDKLAFVERRSAERAGAC